MKDIEGRIWILPTPPKKGIVLTVKSLSVAKCITYISLTSGHETKVEIITKVNPNFQSPSIRNYTKTKPTLPNNTWPENKSKLKLNTAQKSIIRNIKTYRWRLVLYTEKNQLYLLHLLVKIKGYLESSHQLSTDQRL